jgi:hypothetical protein
MTLEKKNDHSNIGRTWADVFSNATVIFSSLIFISLGLWLGWFEGISQIPLWVFASIAMSVIFIPFLIQRAKDDAHLVVVLSGPSALTEYRVGKRYRWNIEGEPLHYSSTSGTRRLLITDFDPHSGIGKGSQLAGFTQFDLARDLGVFTRLSDAFSDHLREERITKEAVAVEVELRVNELASRYLGILYGSLEPTEIENALNISGSESSPVEMELEDILDE